jgi:phage terminase small subunit
MTPKQAAFVREYLIDRNATQAAIRAGYSADTAKQQGSRLLTKVDIMRAVEAKEAKLQERCDVTVESVTKMLNDTFTAASVEKQHAAAVSAAMGIAKLHGLIIDKSQNENRNITADELPDSDLAHIAAGGSAGVVKAKGGEEEPSRVH